MGSATDLSKFSSKSYISLLLVGLIDSEWTSLLLHCLLISYWHHVKQHCSWVGGDKLISASACWNLLKYIFVFWPQVKERMRKTVQIDVRYQHHIKELCSWVGEYKIWFQPHDIQEAWVTLSSLGWDLIFSSWLQAGVKYQISYLKN